jgi:hypothetical protein
MDDDELFTWDYALVFQVGDKDKEVKKKDVTMSQYRHDVMRAPLARRKPRRLTHAQILSNGNGQGS